MVGGMTRVSVGLLAGLICAGALLFALLTFGHYVGIGDRDSGAAADSQADLSRQYGQLPLRFEANRGQASGTIKFLARGPGYTMALGADGAVLSLADTKGSGGVPATGDSAVVGMHLVGGNPDPVVSGANQLPGSSNYMVGADRERWRTDVPSFAQVHYKSVYPGVDMVYRGNQTELQYDLIVAPGSDPGQIAIGFRGSERLSINEAGELLIHAPGKTIRQKRPILYQGDGADRRRVDGRYVLQDSGRRVGFQVGAYDRSRPLVIDPTIAYSTPLGGRTAATGGFSGGLDTTNGITVDDDGNAYVVGFTDAVPPSPYPTTEGALQTSFGGGVRDAFVTKLSPAGDTALYSTYLGGSAEDRATDVAVDESTGNAYVYGFTASTNFPTETPLQAARAGGTDAFVAVLNANGDDLVNSTYLGGSGNETATRIDLDPSGAAYLSGTTRPLTGTTNDFPTTPGAFQPDFGGGAGPIAPNDAFVTKINPGGTALVYSTYLGGPQADTGASVAVDDAGAAYVTGATSSPSIFGTVGAFQTALKGGTDAYVAKLNPGGSDLDYATYVGGTRNDSGRGIGLDSAGSAYITGETGSTDLPTRNANQPANASAPGPFDSDTFVTKLEPDGSDIDYSTYNGSKSFENGTDIAVDAAGNAYAVGNTLGGFPVKDPVQVRTGDYESYLTKFDPDGAVIYSTIYGGASRDFSNAVATDDEGNAYIGGRTDYFSETDSLPVKNAFQPRYASFADAWVAKISSTPTSPLVNSLRSRGGPEGGGTTVVISGKGFTGATAVRFGDTAAADFDVDSDEQITAVSPAHAAGKVNVTVTAPAGTTPANPVTLFEYAEGLWTLTDSLDAVHYDHQSKLLDDGRVLLIGGTNSMFGGGIATTEVYDPRTRQWSTTDALGTPRSSYSATRLDGPACRAASPPAYCGDILVAGGSSNSASANNPLKTAETYDAATGQWTDTAGDLNVARSQQAATLLDGPECQESSPPAHCGKVLVAGGLGRSGTSNVPLGSAELYDPATGQWTATGPHQHTARQTTSVLLPDGKVLLSGGIGSGRQTTEIYDPATGTWDATGDLNIGRERQSVVVLGNGLVLTAAGTIAGEPPDVGAPQVAGDSAELFDPSTRSWTLLPDRPIGAGRNNHDTALLPSGKVLLAGGGRGGLTAELFDPADNRWRSAGLLNLSRGSGHPQAGSYDAVVLSSDPTEFAADPAVCGDDCGKVLVAGNNDDQSTELYTPEPRVDALTPGTGTTGGGTSVRITGQGFTHDVSSVLFGDTPASSFTVDSYSQITAVAPAGSGSQRISVVNEGGRATSEDAFTFEAPPGPGPGPGPGPAPDPGPPQPGPSPTPPDAPGSPGQPLFGLPPGFLDSLIEIFAAKIEIERARVERRDRRLNVLAPITGRASGEVEVEMFAAQRRFDFTEEVDSENRRIRFNRRIPAEQARLGTGIMTITYPGDADTRPQEVRLRAASQKANLELDRPEIVDGRLKTDGTVSRRARGVVRQQLQYVVDGETETVELRGRIEDGRWEIDEALSQEVQDGIARRTGTVHSYTLFTGYFERRIRGEMQSYQVLGDR